MKINFGMLAEWLLNNFHSLSWYIRLSDTYKQDWHAFVQAFKKIHHKRTLIMHKLKLLA